MVTAAAAPPAVASAWDCWWWCCGIGAGDCGGGGGSGGGNGGDYSVGYGGGRGCCDNIDRVDDCFSMRAAMITSDDGKSDVDGDEIHGDCGG